MKIQICGPSGSGKTTMAKFISDKFNTPYIHTNGPELRQKYGCNSHAELIRLSSADPEKGLAFQTELLEERAELSQQKEYVMDRSFVDNVAYFLLQNSPYLNTEQTFLYICKALALMPRCSHLVFIPPLYSKPEEDGVRIQNLHYQKMTWQIMQWVSIEYFRIPVLTTDISLYSVRERPLTCLLNRYDLEWRKEKIEGFLSR